MIANDRVNFPGFGNAVRVSTGRGLPRAAPLATYSGLGREFAAAVLAADTRSLRVALLSFASETKRAEIVPWLLDVGPQYRIEIGSDVDADGHLDAVSEEYLHPFENRGNGFPFELPHGSGMVV